MDISTNTLLLFGLPKTGTTSLWAFLQKHPQIVCTNPKEPLLMHKGNYGLKKEVYLGYWADSKIKENDILVDATPDWWKYNPSFFKNLNIKNIYCLFVIRLPFSDWLRSYLQLFYRIAMQERMNNYVSKQGFIDIQRVETKIRLGYRYDLNKIENILGKNNIVIMNMSDIERDQQRIYKFLGIDTSIYNNVEIYNKTTDVIKAGNGSKNIRLLLSLYSDYIKEEEEIDQKIIREKYNWI